MPCGFHPAPPHQTVHPKTNGKAERLIQTLLREWAYRYPFRTSADRQKLLGPYLHFYNHHRMHSALNDQPPISRLILNNVVRHHSLTTPTRGSLCSARTKSSIFFALRSDVAYSSNFTAGAV